MPDIWGIATIAAKFALYLGILTASGTVIVTLVFGLDRCRAVAIGFGVLGLAATVLHFALGGVALTGDASGLTDPEMLELLWSTQNGTALAFRVFGLSLLIFGLLLGRPGQWMATVGGIVAIWSFALVGHVPDKDSILLSATLLLHLVGIAFWIGVLSPLRRLTRNRSTWPRAAEVGHKFGQVASFAVPLLIVAGGYMGYVLVGSVSELIWSEYGRALLLKVVFVAVLLALAAANKLRFIPGLSRGEEKAAQYLSSSIAFEWGVVVLILGTTAVLTSNLTLPM